MTPGLLVEDQRTIIILVGTFNRLFLDGLDHALKAYTVEAKLRNLLFSYELAFKVMAFMVAAYFVKAGVALLLLLEYG